MSSDVSREMVKCHTQKKQRENIPVKPEGEKGTGIPCPPRLESFLLFPSPFSRTQNSQ